MNMTQKLKGKLRYYRGEIAEGVNEILEYGVDTELPHKELEKLISRLEMVDVYMRDAIRACNTMYGM